MSAPNGIRLIGYPVSNYFNIVRAALIEKDLAHDLDICSANQSEAFLAKNPMGKVPVLAVNDTYLAETLPILEYLDDCYKEVKLRPDDIAKCAKMRQINNIVQVYLEVPARALYPAIFMGQPDSPAQVEVFAAAMDRVITALSRLLNPAPFLLGEAFSQTDIFTFYNLGMAERVAEVSLGRSLIDELGLNDWWEEIGQRPSTRIVMRDFEKYLTTYLEEKKSVYKLVPHFS